MKRGTLDSSGVRLATVEFGGDGPGLLLLHGLMGRATTWTETAKWLTPHFRVVGLDQRGHGLSDKPGAAYTRDHYVNDAIAAIEQLGLAPAVIIGHSMGALNAWVLAARRPDLVCGLILEDMGADTANHHEHESWQKWFASWPVPFASLEHVRTFFGQQRASWADYFMEVMVEHPDGYHPLFSFEHMLLSQREWESRSYWDELKQIRCPTLVVKGADSDLDRNEAQQMARLLPDGRYVEVPNAAHVVHCDNPAGWREVVEPFLLELKVRA